ncbi:hypothetical protein LCGC14_0475960 [marine sediment metagenome]|uniref:Uncharacterized protein n=1 Tax=marine sediment metagenome TaxID=412755 RepID=A0A0F9SG24_9ZZZZ
MAKKITEGMRQILRKKSEQAKQVAEEAARRQEEAEQRKEVEEIRKTRKTGGLIRTARMLRHGAGYAEAEKKRLAKKAEREKRKARLGSVIIEYARRTGKPKTK